MAIDLIRRAAERLSGDGRPSTIERAAVPANGVGPGAGATADQYAEGRSSPRPQRKSKAIKLDLAALRRAGVVTPDAATTQVAEEFRVIKRPLLLKAFEDKGRAGDGRNRLIMVTSALPGEGKSFVALSLALSMASEPNLNILLIDADVKNPSLPRYLGIESDKGLMDLLTDETLDPADVMLRTDVENLSFLPAGRQNAYATEILAGKAMARFGDDMARRYADRIVIFDAPPVLASTEPTVLAMHVGQIVFVVEAEETGQSLVEEALAGLSGCPNVNLLLNKSRPWLGQSGFGAYYGT